MQPFTLAGDTKSLEHTSSLSVHTHILPSQSRSSHLDAAIAVARPDIKRALLACLDRSVTRLMGTNTAATKGKEARESSHGSPKLYSGSSGPLYHTDTSAEEIFRVLDGDKYEDVTDESLAFWIEGKSEAWLWNNQRTVKRHGVVSNVDLLCQSNGCASRSSR